MDRYGRLIERARAGERILIDGGTGSECIRRGVAELPNGWSGGAALSSPDIVRQIHAEYVALGADLVVSNTFATGKNVLEDAGVAEDFEAYNHRAVELAIEARERAGPSADHVVVAGGISNWSFCNWSCFYFVCFFSFSTTTAFCFFNFFFTSVVKFVKIY